MNRRLFKRFISTALSAMLVFSCFTMPAPAEENTAVTDTKAGVYAELSATAEAMLTFMKDSVNNTTDFSYYNNYKNYALILKAGKSDAEVETALLNYLKDNFNENGATFEADISTLAKWYTYIVTFLSEKNLDAANYNNVNYVALLEKSYLEDTDNYNSNYLDDFNPYLEQYVLASLDLFTDKEAIRNKLYNTVSQYDVSDTTGIDVWGYGYPASSDDIGQCLVTLSYFKTSDSSLNQKIEDALNYTSSLLTEKGTVLSTLYDEENYNPIGTTDSVNSTALALKAFVEANDMSNAQKAYTGLLTLKSNNSNGVYVNLTGDDDLYSATPDALMGLLAYYRSLDGHDTLEVIVPESEPVSEPSTEPSTEPDTKAEEESTTVNEETSTSAPAIVSASDKDKEVPPTGDTAPIAVTVTAAILALSLAVYFGLNKKNAK